MAIGLMAVGFEAIGGIGAASAAGLAYSTVIGTSLAYLLWFRLVGTLQAGTVSLASLLVPVVGVIASVVLLAERPTLPDLVGFALILMSATIVLRPQPEASR